jgi:hypothetical protein
MDGQISKSQFLNELKFKSPTHQICFCTLQSLQAIKKTEKTDFTYKFKNITRQIIEKLVVEKGLDKMIATDKFYDSNAFSRLADKTTGFYERDWNEIYKLLLNEFKFPIPPLLRNSAGYILYSTDNQICIIRHLKNFHNQ